MATSPLTKTPTDIMAMIVDLLDLNDLCNLRLTCHWAEYEAFRKFAAFAYETLVVHGRASNMQRLLYLLERSPHLAEAVESISVYFIGYEGPEWEENLKRVWSDKDSRLPVPAGGKTWEPTLSCVGDLLLNVKSLVLDGLNSTIFDCHTKPRRWLGGGPIPKLPADSDDLWSRLHTLHLKDSSLKRTELEDLVCLVGPTISYLSLTDVDIETDE